MNNTQSREMWPGIDVVIPVLNCAVKLRRCLAKIRSQNYKGCLNVIIVDGGSSDNTVQIAEEFKATVYVNPGQYSSGLDGARHFGESRGTQPFIWNIDADNFLIEDTCATDLVRPLMEMTDLCFTFPEIAIDFADTPFNNYLSLDEQNHLEDLKRRSRRVRGVFVTDDCSHGLTNATLIRREVLERVGGYDSDVLVLGRLRAVKLATAALVPSAHFIHSQTTGPFDFRRKWVRRIRHLSLMSPIEIERFFAPGNSRPMSESPVWFYGRWILAGGPRNAIRQFRRTGDSVWLNGLVLSSVVVSIAITHPRAAIRTLATFVEPNATYQPSSSQ